MLSLSCSLVPSLNLSGWGRPHSLPNHLHEITAGGPRGADGAKGQIPRKSMPGWKQSLGILSYNPGFWSQGDPSCGGVLFLPHFRPHSHHEFPTRHGGSSSKRTDAAFPAGIPIVVGETIRFFFITWFKEIIALRFGGNLRAICVCVCVCGVGGCACSSMCMCTLVPWISAPFWTDLWIHLADGLPRGW